MLSCLLSLLLSVLLIALSPVPEKYLKYKEALSKLKIGE